MSKIAEKGWTTMRGSKKTMRKGGKKTMRKGGGKKMPGAVLNNFKKKAAGKKKVTKKRGM